MAIRGAQLFAPYQRRSGWTARPPAPDQPAHPLLRDDPDYVRQVAAAFATAFLNGQQPKPGCLSEGILNHAAADPGSGRNLVHALIALPMLAHLISDDPKHRQLADRKLAG